MDSLASMSPSCSGFNHSFLRKMDTLRDKEP